MSIAPAEAPPAPEYTAAQPFPHLVLDRFFQSDRIARAAAEARGIRHRADPEFYGQQRKASVRDRAVLGPVLRGLLDEMNGPGFVAWLEKVTGIAGLFPDPALFGGGLHQTARGGFLKVHADFSWHAALRAHRRVNVLLYLNEGWRGEWGGHLELWHRDMSACAARIAPEAGRMVIFSTDADSYHGHPEPLACPDEVTRNSLALYFYAAEPARGARSEVTNYRARPGERFGARHLLHQAKRWAERVR